MQWSRREFLTKSALCSGVLPAARLAWPHRNADRVPIRQLTRGPKHHWFGYYDKLQFDPQGARILGMQVEFEHRTPRATDELRLGYVDTKHGDRFVDFGATTAWGWQQGCMLQWRPGSDREVLWNDRDGDRYVSRILDLESGKTRSLDAAIYSVAPDGQSAVGLDFRRVQEMRPGYGYVGLPDPHREALAPAGTGIERIDLSSGERTLLIELAAIAEESGVPAGAKHYFNHLLWNTDGTRFVFLHRWRPAGGGRGFRTRMLTAAADGSDVRLLDGSGRTSHFIWRDPRHVLAWSVQYGKPGFWLFDAAPDGKEPEQLGTGVMTRDGHCSYLPDSDWVLCDTYPDRERRQRPYLFHVPTGERTELAALESPKEYRGEWRCDTHPRFSPDGRQVVVDSPHGGEGRQMWLLDISELLGD